MKGFIEDITWTALVWIVVIVLLALVLAHFLVISLPWGPGSIKYSIMFSDFVNRPYTVAGALTYYKIEDRQLLEHSLESVIVSSIERAKSQAVIKDLESFMKSYDTDYQVTLSNSNIIFSIGKKHKLSTEALVPLLYKGILGYLKVNVR